MEFERAAALRDRIRGADQRRSSGAGHQPPRRARGRRDRAPHWKAGRPACRCSSSAPTRTGRQPRLLPAHRPRHRRTRGAGGLPRPVLRRRRNPPRQLILSHQSRQRRTTCMTDRALARSSSRKVEILVPRRGEKAGIDRRARRVWGRQRPSESPRPPHGRGGKAQGKPACRGWPRPSTWTRRPKRVEVYDKLPHPGRAMRSAR